MAIDVGSAVGYLELDTTKFDKGILGAFNQLSVLGKQSATLKDKFNALGGTLTSVGTTLTKTVTLSLAGLGAAAVKTSADFEAGMSEVKSISRATGSEMDSLKAKALEMGAKTKFSASESADAFKFMAQAGWSASDMISGIEGVMALAAASGEDLALTSSIVTDTLTAFGLSAKDSAKFADTLAMAANATNTGVAELGESFKYIAPVAGALGYNVEDVTIALGAMANSGIKASTAGTSLRAFLTNMVKPTDKMRDAMEKYGISLMDAKGNMLPLGESLDDLRNLFDGLGEAEKASLAATLAGKEGMSGLLAVMNASDESWNSLTENIYNSSGAAKEASEIMQDNLKGSLEQLGGGIESLAIAFGDILSPVIRDIADSISGIVDKLNAMSEAEREQIVKMAGIAAAIGPVLIVAGKLVTTITSIATTFSSLSASFTAASATAGSASAAIGGIAASILPVIAIIAGVIAAVAALKYAWDNDIGGIREKTAIIWGEIQSIFESVTEGITKVVKSFIKAFNNDFLGMKTYVDGILDGIVIIFTGALDMLVEAFGFFADLLKGDWEGAWNHLTNFFKAWYDTLKKFWTSALETLKTVATKIFTQLVDWFGEIPGKITGFFQDLPDKIAYIFGFVLGKLIKWNTDMAKTIKEEVPKLISNIIKFFNELPEKTWDALLGMIVKFIAFCEDMVKSAEENLPRVIAGILIFFEELPDKVVDVGANVIRGLWNGVSSMTSWVTEKITGWCGSFVDGFKNALGIHSPSVLFMTLGGFITEGLANGILDKKQMTADAMQEIADLLEDTGDAISTGLISIEKTTNSLIYDQTYKTVMKKIDLYYKDRDKRIASIKKGSQASIDAIDKELEATKAAYNTRLMLYDQEFKAKQALVDNATNEQVKALQAQIDAIDAQEEAERRAEAEANYQKEVSKKLVEFQAATEEEKQEILKELQELAAERQKDLLAQQREDEKDSLRLQIEEAQNNAEEQKEILQQVYDSKVYQLQQQYQAELNYLTLIKELLNKDYQERKLLEETQTEIKKKEHELQTGNLSKEQKQQTTNEIKELKERESELKTSMDNNKKTLSGYTKEFKGISDKYGDALLTGFKSTESGVKSYLQDLADYANSIVSSIRSAASEARSLKVSNIVGSASVYISGSHKNGLDYVPYDGYVAELHKGEKVLTREEAQGSNASGNTYNFYSPKALTPAESARQMKRAHKELALGFN
jgi:TP901 family phage tail tape measure protein